MKEARDYYGFYANVNPGVTNSIFRDQSTERRLGEFRMRKTLLFNGYADQVAPSTLDWTCGGTTERTRATLVRLVTAGRVS